jgi:hypothetical protein
MASMLSRLGGRGYQVREDQAAYSVDSDPDSDFDPEESLKIVFTKDLYTPENKITVAEE